MSPFAIGNRTQFVTETGGEKTDVLYESNALNQYTKINESLSGSASLREPTHDPDGNVLDDRRNHYTWNTENRMVKVEAKDGSYTVEKSYDYQGRKTIEKHSTKTSVKTTIYLYDGMNLLAEIESEAQTLTPKTKNLTPANSVRYYTWGRDLSGTLQGVGGVGGQLAITKKEENHSDSTIFPCYDANGNICQMISPKAEILAAYQYDAFGRTVDLVGPKAEENEWRFSTKPIETATGFYYYIFRNYDAETGRWSSMDPVGERGGVNLYGFVGNNGVENTDILGLYPPQIAMSQQSIDKDCGCVHLVGATTTLIGDVVDWGIKGGYDKEHPLPPNNGTLKAVVGAAFKFAPRKKGTKDCRNSCNVFAVTVDVFENGVHISTSQVQVANGDNAALLPLYPWGNFKGLKDWVILPITGKPRGTIFKIKVSVSENDKLYSFGSDVKNKECFTTSFSL